MPSFTPEPQSLYSKLSSDTIIVILDFYGGVIEGQPIMNTDHPITSDSGQSGVSFISQLIKNCFGKFNIDSSIKFMYRYGVFEETVGMMVPYEGLVFLCNEQYKQVKCSTMDGRILKGLCECPMKQVTGRNSRRVLDEELLEKDQEILKKSLEKLTQFQKEHKLLCEYFKVLDFYSMETYWELIEKSIEIFPNFEKLIVGFPKSLPAKVRYPVRQRTYQVSSAELNRALEKSNRKCKTIKSHSVNILEGGIVFHLPSLEKYNLLGGCSVKSIENIEQLKNLRVLKADHPLGGYYKNIEYSLPSFFQSLAKCHFLTILEIHYEQLYGEEFIHLTNNLPNLTYLNLGGCTLHEYGTEVFEAIGTFHNLKILVLPNHEGKDQALEKLVTLTRLEYLESDSIMTAQGVQAISQMTSLKSLIIGSLHVTNDEGKVLVNLKNLKQFRFKSGDKNHFSINLILYLFKNLNVTSYDITYYHQDIEKLPKTTRDRMNSYVMKATETYKAVLNL